jgi:Icc-related predicted phosphoesterase
MKRVIKIKPKLHIFGHIHEAAGRIDINGTTFVNVAKNPTVL